MSEKSEKKSFKEKIMSGQIWKSIWRHDFEDTGVNRGKVLRSNVFLHLHPIRVPKHAMKIRFTWCMGGITFFAFLVECITGILLMFYYHPTVDMAYLDMKYLMFDVPFGQILRNMHRWGAHLMVFAVMLHMLRVFLTASYKPPREFNWVVGVLLLTLTLLMSFTGYLLPWDQLAFWAITVGTNMGAATPFLGAEGPFTIADKFNDVRFVLLGGTTVGANALLRFYVLHVIAVPVVVCVFMAIHFWRIRKDGGISRPL